MFDEAEFEESVECPIDGASIHCESISHAFATVERGSVTICCQSKQDKHGSRFGSELLEPALFE